MVGFSRRIFFSLEITFSTIHQWTFAAFFMKKFVLSFKLSWLNWTQVYCYKLIVKSIFIHHIKLKRFLFFVKICKIHKSRGNQNLWTERIKSLQLPFWMAFLMNFDDCCSKFLSCYYCSSFPKSSSFSPSSSARLHRCCLQNH